MSRNKLAFNQIYQMDCLAGMAALESGIVDLIITDPPFAIDFKAKRANYHRRVERVLEGYHEINQSEYKNFTQQWLEAAYRILKDSGSMYVFSGWNQLKVILNALDDVGFIVVNHLIWKYQFGVVTRRKYVTSHYHCLYVCKNDKLRRFYPFARYGKDAHDTSGHSLHYQDKQDVWTIQREYWQGDYKTPTKLPAEIIRKILAYSSVEGDLVCDPFLGSGQVAVVSKEMKRHYIGFELSREYYEFAKDRLSSGEYRLKIKRAN
jgi:site-specific DNA-methyltransferase (adenine-specific)